MYGIGTINLISQRGYKTTLVSCLQRPLPPERAASRKQSLWVVLGIFLTRALCQCKNPNQAKSQQAKLKISRFNGIPVLFCGPRGTGEAANVVLALPGRGDLACWDLESRPIQLSGLGAGMDERSCNTSLKETLTESLKPGTWRQNLMQTPWRGSSY